VDFPERTRQPAAARLWASKNIEHKKNDISFILNPMATEFLRDVCKDMKHIVVEGHGHWSDGTTGMCMPTSSSVAARFSGQQAQKGL
jgi:hypothetical protein